MSNDTICYSRVFLRQVIVRLDFAELISNDKLFDKQVIASIAKTFPHSGKKQVVKFEEMSFKLDSIKGATVERGLQEGLQQEFYDSSKKNKLVLSNKALVLEINEYSSYEKSISSIKNVLKIIMKENDITVIRTGIRYINIFSGYEIKLNKNLFANDIGAMLEKNLPIISRGAVLQRAMAMKEYRYNDMTINFRYGMFNPDYPGNLKKNDFTLDLDCYTQEPITGFEDILDHIHDGHDAIQELFEGSITNNLRKIMKDE